MIRRLAISLVLGYVTLALLMRVREAMGLIRCDCYPDCWCQRPGLSLFRWVFSRHHYNPGLEAWKKRRLAEGS